MRGLSRRHGWERSHLSVACLVRPVRRSRGGFSQISLMMVIWELLELPFLPLLVRSFFIFTPLRVFSSLFLLTVPQDFILQSHPLIFLADQVTLYLPLFSSQHVDPCEQLLDEGIHRLVSHGTARYFNH